MVRSKFLDGLKTEEKGKFIEERLDLQGNACFICEEPLDLKIQKFVCIPFR